MPRTMLGRYRLDDLIGSGGMGEVWRAHDPVLERDVAVKVLRRDVADDAAALERLRIEARLAGSLHHPHVVGVLDYGEEPDDGESGVLPCLVMPLIEGCTLSELVQEAGPMSPADAMRMVADVADGLSAAHLAGIVHRDLKPGNIMVDAAGRSMILDFGIARSSDASPLTSTGTIVGTTDFISPEQASGRSATPASDLYSLGVVAYCCLTGRAPFHHTAAVAIALAHVNDPPPALPDTVPVAVQSLVTQMLAKDPDDRPADAEEVRTRAQQLADELAIAESPRVHDEESTTVLPLPAMETTTMTPPPVEPARRKRRLNPVLLVALVIGALVALAVVALTRGGGIEVPDVVGQPVADATARLEDAGLKVHTRSRDVAGHRRGEVVDQTPDAGDGVDNGSTVELVVASGFVAIPDLQGKTQASAVAALKKLGLDARVSTRVTSATTAGRVVAVAPDDRARIGDTVDLVVATAPSGTPDPKKSKKPKSESKSPKPEPEPKKSTTTEPSDPPSPSTDAPAATG